MRRQSQASELRRQSCGGVAPGWAEAPWTLGATGQAQGAVSSTHSIEALPTCCNAAAASRTLWASSFSSATAAAAAASRAARAATREEPKTRRNTPRILSDHWEGTGSGARRAKSTRWRRKRATWSQRPMAAAGCATPAAAGRAAAVVVRTANLSDPPQCLGAGRSGSARLCGSTCWLKVEHPDLWSGLRWARGTRTSFQDA